MFFRKKPDPALAKAEVPSKRELLRRLLEIKYRELTALIGKTITITSLDAVSPETLAVLAPYTRGSEPLKPGFDNRRATLAKYGILDLSFSTATRILRLADRVDREKLINLGILEGAEVSTSDEELSCIADLVVEAGKDEEWVKIFLDVWPKRNGEEYLSAMQTALEAEPGNPNASAEAFTRLMAQVDELFPSQFRIRDACITNAPGIWFGKHFYM